MQRLLCPYCDHEIKGKGKCEFCGSKVKKPVVTETSDEFYTQDFAQKDSRTMETGAAAGAGVGSVAAASMAGTSSQTAANTTGASPRTVTAGMGTSSQAGTSSRTATAGVTGAPRRAVLASEAVEAGKASGTMKPASTTSQKVVKIIIGVIIVNFILQLIFMFLNL